MFIYAHRYKKQGHGKAELHGTAANAVLYVAAARGGCKAPLV